MGKNTYVAVGNAEDISDVITNISPKDTPFFSACGKVKATATNHEWLEDSLRAPADNKKVEGFEYAVSDPTPRVRLGNYTQIFSVGYGVTNTQEVVMKHGVTSEIAYQMRKAMKEIAMDVERALITQAAKSAGSATVARQFGGVPFFIGTNTVNGAAGDPISEEMMNDALQKCWEKGGVPKKVYLSGNNKRIVSSWSGDGDKYLEQNSKKLVSAINVYESDFGIVSFVAHRMMDDNKVFVIDPDYWKVAELRKMHTKPLPETGDNKKRVIVGEMTLEARAEKANAVITLTPGP
ncbi:MAG: DUF5309 domain-containing protein [Synergistaceae bacterium]|jgi:hypothetical protein|nr:DUF5309 domain-containing protein [Synergistaceae bacterium]